MTRRPFFISGILGLGAVAMTLILSFVGPRPATPLPAGFITPVLAFEFAENEAEVRQIVSPNVRSAMDRVNQFDFLYIALYGGCLFTFALTCDRLTGRRLFFGAAALAIGIMVADILENVQLLAITARMDDGGFEGELARLRLFTWLKWGGLAVYFALLRAYFARLTGPARWLGAIALSPLLLGAAAFLSRGPISELFALSIGLMFLLLTFYAWWFRRPAAAQMTVPPAVGRWTG
jgi:hypothetical protein